MSKFIINSKTNACRTFGQFIKGLHYGLHILKIEPKFSSSSFVIRANVLHLEPFLFLYGLVVSLIFFCLSKLLFSGLLNFKYFCCLWPNGQ